MAAAAEGVEGNVPGGGEEKKGGGSSKLLLIGLPIALLIGGAGGAYFADMLPMGGGAEEPAPVDGAEPDPAFAATVMVPLDSFIANLGDGSGGRYIKTTMELEFAGTEAPPVLERRMPQVRDLILTLLTSKTYDDIRSPEGKQILRDEIIRRVNQSLQEDAVQAVYFTEFIVQ